MKAIVLATILLIQVVLFGQLAHTQQPVEVPSKPIVNNNNNGGSSSTVSYSSSTTTVVVESKSSYSSLNGVSTPSKDKPLGIDIEVGGTKYQTFADALGRPFYVAQNGNIKYFDSSNPSSPNFPTSLQSKALTDNKNRRYFVDSQGNAFYMDAKTGLPFYIDNNNKEYFVDSYDRIFFRDSLGRYYYIDGKTGRQIFFLPPSKVKEIPGLNLADIPSPGTTQATPTTSTPTTGTKPPIVVVVRPVPSPIVGIPIPVPVPSKRPHPPKPVASSTTKPTTSSGNTGSTGSTTGTGSTTTSGNSNNNNNGQTSSIYVNTPSGSAQIVNPNGLAGGPFVDSQGRVYYKDQNGMATYQNSETGESYYIDPVSGQCFMLNQLGEHIACPSNLQTAAIGNSATAANSASTSRKKTYYYNDGRIYMVNEDGSLVETNTPLAQSNQIVQSSSSSGDESSKAAPLKGYTVIDGKMYWIDENTGGTLPFSQSPTNNRS